MRGGNFYPPSLNLTWHLDAASNRLASAGLIDLSNSCGEPLIRKILRFGINLLLLEVDQILIVGVDANVCKSTPCFLYFFSSDRLLRLLLALSFGLQVWAPGPLDLDRTDMVHRKTMILKQSPRQRHLVSCLDQRCTEVLHATVFIFCHHVEGRR